MHGFSAVDLWQNTLFVVWYKILWPLKLIASLAETIRNDKSVFGNFTQLFWGASLNEKPTNCRTIAS